MQQFAKYSLLFGVVAGESPKSVYENDLENADIQPKKVGHKIHHGAEGARDKSLNWVDAAFENTKKKVEGGKNKVQDTGKDALHQAKKWGDDALEEAKKMGEDALAAVTDGAEDAFFEAENKAESLLDDAKSTGEDALHEAKDAGMDARDDAKDAAEDARDKIEDAAEDARDDIKKAAENARDDVKKEAEDSRDAIGSAGNGLYQDAKDISDKALNDVAEDAKDLAEDKVQVDDLYQEAKDTTEKALKDIADDAKDLAENTINADDLYQDAKDITEKALTDAAEDAKEFAEDAVQATKDKIEKSFRGFKSKGSNLLDGKIDKTESSLRSVWNDIRDYVDETLEDKSMKHDVQVSEEQAKPLVATFALCTGLATGLVLLLGFSVIGLLMGNFSLRMKIVALESVRRDVQADAQRSHPLDLELGAVASTASAGKPKKQKKACKGPSSGSVQA